MHHNEPTRGVIALFDRIEHSLETDPLEWVQVTRWMVASEENKRFIEKELFRLDAQSARPFLLREQRFGQVSLFRHRFHDDCEDIICGYCSAFQDILKYHRKDGCKVKQITLAGLRAIKHGG